MLSTICNALLNQTTRPAPEVSAQLVEDLDVDSQREQHQHLLTSDLDGESGSPQDSNIKALVSTDAAISMFASKMRRSKRWHTNQCGTPYDSS